MVKIKSKPLNKSLEIGRVIGHVKGDIEGPTIIFIAGIHGNEPSGIFALQQVLSDLQKNQIALKGNIYAISGNLWALKRGIRYQHQDLNRLWTTEIMERLNDGELEAINEDVAQQLEIHTTIKRILDEESGPFYLMDLHTTSSDTLPFMTVNDSLLNRAFTMQYPMPIILGIEEFLDGPLLSYANELGYVAFGFEAGSHDSIDSYHNHIAFIYLSIVFSGNADQSSIDFDKYFKQLDQASIGTHDFYEISTHYKIKPEEDFVMKPGYINFKELNKGDEIAVSNGNVLTAEKNGNIFMPLYQNQGEDGFFTINKIATFSLKLSALMRTLHVDRILRFLPGVSMSDERDVLIVNRKVAKFFTKEIFHLMGYRKMSKTDKSYIMKNRESTSRVEEYRHMAWNKA